jgi:hypothetical protein
VALLLEPLCLERKNEKGKVVLCENQEEIRDDLAWLLHSGDMCQDDYNELTQALEAR